MSAKVRLVFAEHVHGEAIALHQGLEAGCAVGQAENTMGGSRESEVMALMVAPTGLPDSIRPDSTVTPVANLSRTWRNLNGSWIAARISGKMPWIQLDIVRHVFNKGIWAG